MAKPIKPGTDNQRPGTYVLRSKRTNAADQIQMSLIRFDGEPFVEFRKALHTGDYLVILKAKGRLNYQALGIKAMDVTEDLRRLNNKFFKLSTNTVVNAAEDFLDHEKVVNTDTHRENYTIEELASILRKMYNNAKGSGQVAAIHMFGFKYGDVILSNSYEDFIQGLRPDSKNGVLDFIPVDGVFKQLAYTAMHDPVNNYVIIIDEINRGNISKVFGELITLIEDDKRWGEDNQLSVILPSGEEFAVPNNLYIIGTMNSADKSIALIDTALRRRFEFEEVAPNPELVEDETLKKVLVLLNTLLRKQLDSSDLLIGHAYFIGKTASDLPNILNRNIIPLLYEYFYDQEKKVKDALAKALEGTAVTFDENNQGRIKVK